MKLLPPAGIRVIVPTLWYPPTSSCPFGEINAEKIAEVVLRDYEAGHRVFMTGAGSGSGFDILPDDAIEICAIVSQALADFDDVWIYASCVSGLDQCWIVAESVKDMCGVKGLLLLPNRHPHTDAAGWISFYKMLSAAMNFPYIIYRVAPGITVDQYVELAEDPNFIELKWATGDDLNLLAEAVPALEGKVSVVCGLGDLNGPEWVEQYGVRGWTSYTVSAGPFLCKQIETAALGGKPEVVQAIQGPVKAFEAQRFGANVRFNNRLVVCALEGRDAFLRPPNAAYTEASWPAAEKVIVELAAADSQSEQLAMQSN
jgi:dihydrodipicolinate synthase/N-acetylneuraminate lyase